MRFTAAKSPQLYSASLAQRYANTLLHEMTHVILKVYACGKCEEEYKSSTTGLFDHGSAFMTLARAIGHAAGPLLGDKYGGNHGGKWDPAVENSKAHEAQAIELAAGWQRLVSKGDSAYQGRILLNEFVRALY